mmetsp:Transcript_6342/g.15229  ORF Transcript_6342/g.15229 Transcript_6342/m.15229 type:complete len:84 (-) Transcript_6342:209-460(-)
MICQGGTSVCAELLEVLMKPHAESALRQLLHQSRRPTRRIPCLPFGSQGRAVMTPAAKGGGGCLGKTPTAVNLAAQPTCFPPP